MTEQSLIERDAQEFGQHVKLGGWRLGLLVARNVEKGRRGGDTTISQSGNAKLPAYRFAELAGVGKNKVLRYLEAWNKAAADIEELPTADELAPGNEIDLDEEWCEAHSWGKYYTTVNKKPDSDPEGDSPTQEEQHRAFRESITRDPEFAKAAADALREHAPETQAITPEQVREAVRTNPEVEEAAREEAFQQMRDRARLHSSTYDPTIPPKEDLPAPQSREEKVDDLLTLMDNLRKAEKSLTEAMYAAQRIGHTWEPNKSVTETSRDLCDMIDAALQSGGLDAELADLVEKGI
nr:MAG TPA: hypothetical protein [Caudoviricetes sp.]